jgi:HlyD family secretion protein
VNVQLPALLRSALPATLAPDASLALPAIDDPHREVGFGALVAGAFFILFLGWASVARLDAAATAPGEITVSGHRQTIQHRDGGVISALYVKEAQRVRAGDVLLRLSGPEVEANERALAAQVIGLQARRARLQAEQFGLKAIQWPAAFAGLVGQDQAEAAKAETIEQSEFATHASAVEAQKKVLAQKTAELGEQIRGYQRQVASADQQQQLLGQELSGIQSLAARGFAPMNKVRELQRTQAQISGQRGQYAATIAQSQQQAGEARLQILQVEKTDQQQVANDLHDVETQLNDAAPKWEAAKVQLAKTQIRAPVSGSVVGLSVFTVGGVVAPGQKLMDIVPDQAPLLVEARISPNDADDLHAGETAEVRFVSVHDRSLPILNGTVTKVSADSFTDEKTGARYFTAEVSVPLSQLTVLEKRRDKSFELKPGLPVQVMVPLRKRTALQYLMEPLTDAIWRSFREH